MDPKESHQEGGGKPHPLDMLGQRGDLPCQMSEARSITDKGFAIRPRAREKRIRSGWDSATERA